MWPSAIASTAREALRPPRRKSSSVSPIPWGERMTLSRRSSGDDPGADRRRGRGQPAPDVAEADDAGRPAFEAGPDVREAVPGAAADMAVHLGEPVREREHERHPARGHRTADAVRSHGDEH